MLNFENVISYLKNGDETHFTRKAWNKDRALTVKEIFLDKKTNEISLIYQMSYSKKKTIAYYFPNSEDMFAFDWEVVE